MSTAPVASPELDALVAEKVMGWTQTEGMYGRMWWGNPHGNHQLWTVEAFCPSTDIAAAWQVVEHMATLGYGVNFGNYAHRESWNVWFGRQIDEDIHAEATTAPLAICRAALAAVAGAHS